MPGPLSFSEAEITDCLMSVVAWAGNVSAAHRQLTADKKRAPAEPTLREWTRGVHAGRYNELREKYSAQLEQQLAHEYRDVARQAVEVQRLALTRAHEQLESGRDKDPSRSAANAARVAQVNTDKLLSLTGRPTQIREDRNLEEIMRGLVARGVLKPPDEPVQLPPIPDVDGSDDG